jgi:uncharacterized protein involved in exopolysaccharide biosynthesis
LNNNFEKKKWKLFLGIFLAIILGIIFGKQNFGNIFGE